MYSVRRVSDYLSSYIDLDDYKKYRKEYRKLHEKLLRFGPTFKEEGTSKSNLEPAQKRGKKLRRRWQTSSMLNKHCRREPGVTVHTDND